MDKAKLIHRFKDACKTSIALHQTEDVKMAWEIQKEEWFKDELINTSDMMRWKFPYEEIWGSI